MQIVPTESAPGWEQVAPLLDAALNKLAEADRAVIVLRFFEKKTAADIAARLNLSEDAAQKRVYRALDRLRMLSSRSRLVDPEAEPRADEFSDTGAEIVKSEQGEIVRRALRELPEEQRRPLLLAYFEGLTQAEIAERLGDPLGTVKTRMRSGLSKLRELLRDRSRDLV